MQVHQYYMGSGKDTPAELMRDFVERDFMERYHWTPQQIAGLNYKWIQRFYLIEKMRKEATEAKAQVDQFKSGSNPNRSSGRGQKRMVLTGSNVVSSNKNRSIGSSSTKPK